MQTIKTKSTRRKMLAILVVSVVALIGVATTYVYVNNIGPFEKDTPENIPVNYEEPTEEQIVAGQETKEESVKVDKPKTSSTNSSTNNSSNSNGTVAVEITNEPKNNSGSLSVKTLVQEVSSTGVCTLTLSKSGQTSVVKSAKTQVSGTVATCEGFTIDVSNLSKGTWSIRIDYKSAKSVGSTSESVTL